MANPTYADLLGRLEDLEQRQIGVRDLPLAALQRTLEQDWQPSAAVLLGDASITASMLTLKVIRGEVSAAGAVALGAGFTATRVSAGVYDVVFTAPFSATPVITAVAGATANPAGAVIVAKLNAAVLPTAAGFRMNTQNSATGASVDSIFDFIAYEV